MNGFDGSIPILNVKNFAASMDYYVNKLGFEKKWDWGNPAAFGCVSRGKVSIFLCEGAQGRPGMWMSIFLHDVDALHEEYKKSGAIIREPPMNFPWEHREMLVEDLDGHRFRMSGEPTGPADENWNENDRFRSVPSVPAENTKADLKALTELNALYIRSVVHADAAQFERLLAGDFLCSNPDASVINKQEFLRRTRASSTLQYMDTDDVRIRVMGDVAIIHARTSFATAEGARGTGCYTDVWARRDGRWLAVSAHVTRLAR